MLDKRLPLDHFFQEGMRQRLDCATMIDRLLATIAMLSDCAEGRLALTKMQIEAAKATLVGLKIALAKTLPDLQSTTLSSPDGGVVTIQVVQFGREAEQIGDSENTRLRLAPPPTSN
ncbi:MAG: hypothetical protein A2Z03_12415 [Chloroflexi bacterium RBG_16_56_8]|nr:MAG: hypothetical protein A2Z03_12415 [Chloroflexi bacterium RBG_16_56_8]